jgi:putative addiction module component (TIGR02574 family)
MTAAGERILEQALVLSDEERAELAAILADSVGDGTSAPELEAAWSAESRRRLEQIRSGAAGTIPAEDVDLELDALVAPR